MVQWSKSLFRALGSRRQALHTTIISQAYQDMKEASSRIEIYKNANSSALVGKVFDASYLYATIKVIHWKPVSEMIPLEQNRRIPGATLNYRQRCGNDACGA